jgi:hypothetical protein
MAGVTLLETESLVFAENDLSKTANLSAVTDWTKCVLFFSRRLTSDSGTADMSDWAEHCVRGDITSTPSIVIDRTGAGTGTGDSLVDVTATAVQFGSGVSVTRVPFTIAEGLDSVTVGGFSVTQANAFMNFSYKQASYPGGHNSLTAIRGRMISGTQLTFDRNHETLTCSDMTFTNTSGSSVQITSPLAELPNMQVGDKFVVTAHSVGALNATYTVTTRTTGEADYTVTSDGTPQNAVAESADAEIQGPQVDGIAYVAESTSGADFTVQHLTGTLANSSSTQDITITTTVNAAKSFLLSSFNCADTTDNNDNCPMVWILDGDNVRSKRDGTTGDVLIAAQVVTFTGTGESVQRGTFADTSVDADVDDAVFGTFTGGQCTITSAGGNIPTMSNGDQFYVDQTTGSQNDGIWIVDTFTSTSSILATRQLGAGDAAAHACDMETAILAAVGHGRQNDAPYDVDITDVSLTVGMAVIPGPQSFRNGFAPGVNQQDIGDAYYMAELINSGADVRVTRGREGSERLTEGSWEVIEWELDSAGGTPRRIMVVS